MMSIFISLQLLCCLALPSSPGMSLHAFVTQAQISRRGEKKKSSMLWIEFLKCSCMSSEDSSSSEVVHVKFEEMRAEKHASNVEFLKVRVIFSLCVVW